MSIYIIRDKDGRVLANSLDFKHFLMFSIENKDKLEDFDIEVLEEEFDW